MLTIYGIPSCDTCRRARRYFTTHEIDCRFHDLRSDGLNIGMLRRWADRVGWELLLNKRSLTWRKVPEVDREGMNRDRACALMLANPTLIKRPILEHEQFIAVGFSEKRFAAFVQSGEFPDA